MSSSLFVGVGPVLLDQFVHCDVLPEDDDLPHPGTKRHAEDDEHMRRVRKRWVDGWAPETQVGGPVPVALRQAAQLGAAVDFSGAISDDDIGHTIADHLVATGFSYESLVVQHGRRSGSAIVWIDRRGERSILFDSGSLEPLDPSDVKHLQEESPAVVHIDSREPAAASALATWGRSQGSSVHYKIDPWKDWTPELLAVSTVAQASWHEVEHQWPDAVTADSITKELQSRFELQLAIVINRARGVYAVEAGGREYDVPAFQVNSVDSVGIGDVFGGSFEMSLRNGQSVENALRSATAAAAIHSTRLGNRQLPNQGEIDRLLSST